MRIAPARLLPGLPQFRRYRRGWLRGDLIAGITVAAYLVPQVMAYATVAGLPPVTGLWAIIGPLAVYALVGGSRQLSVGPESSTALLTAVALGPLAAGDPQRYAALAVTLAVLVGVLCLIGWLLRLGLLADLLSKPVLIGYLAGIAVIMIASQLGTVTGIDVTEESVPGTFAAVVTALGEVHLPTLLLAVAVLVLLLSSAALLPRTPSPLLAVLLAAVVVAVFSLRDNGIDVVGAVPAGLPVPGFGGLDLTAIGGLLLPAVGIVIVGFSDNVLTARAFAGRRGETVDTNQELLALGVTNLAAGAMRGFPVSCSGSRTALGDATGSRTQLYSLVALAAVLLTLLAAGPVLAGFPTAALGALVIYAALRLVDVDGFARLARFSRSELVLALACTVAVLAFGVLYGVLAAAGLSIMDLLRKLARPHDGILGYVPGLAGMHDIDDYPGAVPVPGLVVYRYDAPLCFANAENFRRRALASLDVTPERTEWFVLNTEANVRIDMTAADVLHRLRRDLAERDVVFALARVKQDVRVELAAAGLVDAVGEERIFPTLPTAVAAYVDWYTERHGRRPPGLAVPPVPIED